MATVGKEILNKLIVDMRKKLTGKLEGLEGKNIKEFLKDPLVIEFKDAVKENLKDRYYSMNPPAETEPLIDKTIEEYIETFEQALITVVDEFRNAQNSPE